MKRTTTKLLTGVATAIGLAFAGPVAAAEAANEAGTETVAANPALFRVADEDTTITMMGTVHLLPKNLDWFNGAVKDSFEGADTLVMELIQPDQATAIAGITKFAVDPEGRNLRERLTEEQRATYEAALSGLGLPVESFDKYEPWYAYMNIYLLATMQSGFDPMSGAEMVLTGMAEKADKPMEGLETFEGQLGILDGLSDEDQLELLTFTTEHVAEIGTELSTLVGLWRTGDQDGIGVYMAEYMGEGSDVEADLLAKRNANWADWIEKRLDEPGEVFIAVGAAHLAGKNSVQKMLRDRDVSVVRIDD